MKTSGKKDGVFIVSLWTIVSLALLPLPTYGDIPHKINYQGILTDSGGRRINSAVSIRFSIYDVATGGTALWTETQDVSVSEGLFSVDLGALVPLNLAFDLPYYLGVKVEPAEPEMTPRKLLTSVPYTFRAKSVETDTLKALSCSAGQVPNWSGSAWVCGNAGAAYTAGPGLNLSGTQFSADATYLQRSVSGTCADGNAIRVINADGSVICQATGGGSVPSSTVVTLDGTASPGAASEYSRGDHKHDIGAGVVGTAQIQDSAITDVKITGLISGAKLGNHSHYRRTVVVSPLGTGTENGTGLLNAMAGITDASSLKPYLLKIEPGTYDLGTSSLEMKPYVDIEGSGENTTKITAQGSASMTTGTVNGANNAEIRFLTIENTGGDSYAFAICNMSVSPALTHITVIASGGSSSNRGIFNQIASPTLASVAAAASGGVESVGILNVLSLSRMTNVSSAGTGASSSNYGIRNSNSSPVMTNVALSASGGASANTGVSNENSFPIMTNISATVSGATNTNVCFSNGFSSSPRIINSSCVASGGNFTYGVANSSSSSSKLMNMSITVSGGNVQNYGVINMGSSSSSNLINVTITTSGGTYSRGVYNESGSQMTVQNSTISATGGSSENHGINSYASSGAYSVSVNHSQITADVPIHTNSYYTTYVGASRLNGGAVTGGGTFKCVGVYNGNYDALNSSCQ